MATPLVSLVVATLGRKTEFRKLLHSLERQEYDNFELIVVEQNEKPLIKPILDSRHWTFPITHIRTPGERGISRGRNVGWRQANGDMILFPDDDCWYPANFLAEGIGLLRQTGADIVTGRSADESGRSINGRYADRPQFITPRSVWICQMEWVTFVQRRVLEALDGFDEGIGIGAPTPWQAAEGPDFILRALDRGFRGYFDPNLFGHHAEFETGDPGSGMIWKGRIYARGMGFVLRKHGFGVLTLSYWVSRSLFNCIRHFWCGDPVRARFYLAVGLGRIEGWIRRPCSPLAGFRAAVRRLRHGQP
jgi:glycosyltransferase involved in cell wall biosynthesis